MANILNVLTPRELINYVDNVQFAPRVGDSLFPNRKTASLEIEYLKGANGLPVVASVHSWDSETQVGTRPSGDTVAYEMALIKRKLAIREKEVIAFSNPRNDAELNALIEARFNDVKILVDGVLAKAEAMKMEAVATGVITLNENGIVGTIDYGVPADQKLVLTDDAFNVEGVDMIGHLQGWVDTMRAKGVIVTRAITSNNVIRLMAADPAVRDAVLGTGSGLVSLNAMNEFFAVNGLPKFIPYDEMYNQQNGDGTYTTRRFFPADYIALLPDAPLGEGLFGPTAEEIELTSDPSFNVEMVGNVLAMVYKSADPVIHWTKAVASFMPSFTAANSVMSVKVIAPETEPEPDPEP